MAHVKLTKGDFGLYKKVVTQYSKMATKPLLEITESTLLMRCAILRENDEKIFICSRIWICIKILVMINSPGCCHSAKYSNSYEDNTNNTLFFF